MRYINTRVYKFVFIFFHKIFHKTFVHRIMNESVLGGFIHKFRKVELRHKSKKKKKTENHNSYYKNYNNFISFIFFIRKQKSVKFFRLLSKIFLSTDPFIFRNGHFRSVVCSTWPTCYRSNNKLFTPPPIGAISSGCRRQCLR